MRTIDGSKPRYETRSVDTPYGVDLEVLIERLRTAAEDMADPTVYPEIETVYGDMEVSLTVTGLVNPAIAKGFSISARPPASAPVKPKEVRRG